MESYIPILNVVFTSKRQALQVTGSPIQAVELEGDNGSTLFFIRLNKIPNTRNKWRYVKTILSPQEQWQLAQWEEDDYEEVDDEDNETTHT